MNMEKREKEGMKKNKNGYGNERIITVITTAEKQWKYQYAIYE